MRKHIHNKQIKRNGDQEEGGGVEIQHAERERGGGAEEKQRQKAIETEESPTTEYVIKRQVERKNQAGKKVERACETHDDKKPSLLKRN